MGEKWSKLNMLSGSGGGGGEGSDLILQDAVL